MSQNPVEESLKQLPPAQAEDIRQIGYGMALVRMLKAVAGMLARRACIAQGIDPDKADEWQRGGVRIEYGEPIPGESLDRTGATIFRRALVLIEDKYLYADVQLVMQPPRRGLHVRALVGHMDYADEIDPGRTLGVEWVVSPEVDSGTKLY